MHRRTLLPFAPAALVAVTAALLAGGVATAELPSRVPECELQPLGDEPAADLLRTRGEVMIVDFWASWCVSCAEALPFLDRLERELGDRGLRVVGINVDEERADALAFIARHPVGFALAADPSGSCPRRFGVEAMPAAYLVDRAGRIRHVQRGFRSGEASKLREQVLALLAEDREAAVVAEGAPDAEEP